MAFPREALQVTDQTIAALRAVVEEEAIGGIVVGAPRSLMGNDTDSTRMAQLFFDELFAAFPELPMEQFDERLTTTQAQRSLSAAGKKAKEQRGLIDSAAAVVMLQSFLDGRQDA
jgi:putative Holliday junction resolvase